MSEVTIYTRMMCGYCAAAKRVARAQGHRLMSSTDASFSTDLRQEMIQKAGGRATFPQSSLARRMSADRMNLHALESRGQLDSLLAARESKTP